MAGDCTYTHYRNDDTLCLSKALSDRAQELMIETDNTCDLIGRGSMACSPNFEIIDGLQYRKKLEQGFIHYREVLDQDRRHGAISTFHRRRPGTRHLSLEETYKAVAENYWWDGMYFHIRDYVLGCSDCQKQQSQRTMECGSLKGSVSKTMMSHSHDILSKLRSQREAGLFCDITLRTNGQSYSAHKAVLAAVSEYFQEVFAEMDSTPSLKTDIDLTGFREDNLVSLLDFSYSSTLSVRPEDLPEVSTMARHLGMWPAVEACSALQREQKETLQQLQTQFQKDRKRIKLEAREGELLGFGKDGFRWTLDQSNESLTNFPRRSPRIPHSPGPGPTSLHMPLSPTNRMKLMDFKSPSSKRTRPPRNTPSSPHTHTRLLRSTPGAAQEVQRLLPRPESPRRGQKPCPSSSSRQEPKTIVPLVRVKEEEEEQREEEEDHVRVLEKYRLMNVLGLQRTSLLSCQEELIGWRQKKRLRKLKVNNYSLTKRRKPCPQVPGLAFRSLPLSLPLCNAVNTRLLKQVIKTEPSDPVNMVIRPKRPRSAPRPVPPSDRSMRSKVVLPNLRHPISRQPFGGRELRRSVRGSDGAPFSAQPPPCHDNAKPLRRNVIRIKPEPYDFAISAPPLPVHSCHGVTHMHNPPLTRAHPRDRVNTTRAVRYNSGRPVAKTKVRMIGGREVGKAQRPTKEECLRTDSRLLLESGLEESLGVLRKKRDTVAVGTDPDVAPVPHLYTHPLYRAIKEEPVDPLPVGLPFSEPPSPDLGKRLSKPPVKLLDPGFLFSFCRPPGGPVGVVKREEESVDICLTRSVSRGERFGDGAGPVRVLRARGLPPNPTSTQVKKERVERRTGHDKGHRQGTRSCHHKHQPPPQHKLSRLTKSPPQSKSPTHGRRSHAVSAARSKPGTPRDIPKKRTGPLPLHGRSAVLQQSVRRARLKQLRGLRSGRGKGWASGSPPPKAPHSCLECHSSFRDCDALLIHRIRHIKGKHWPCPLCSKTFFRQKNVRNHIRTHDQQLYRCRSCMAAS
ncbi:uncharacterized protein si:dkey-229b18.3 isoform X1 [Osmerus eperlanus]|uniref:uncharacterized protein si:dkey-229b18.3 isoform X1 n=2 Tax=Osmerus eperlanus TaxID=29151 RepID=UPI002E0F7F21